MFQQLNAHTWYRPAEPYADRPNIGLICGQRAALLFEAGNSPAHAEQLRGELANAGLPLPTYVAVSHWHWDHTFGLAGWRAVTVAGAQTNRQLREVSKWKWDDASMQARVASREDILFCNEMIKREYPVRSQIRVIGAEVEFDSQMQLDLGGVHCRLLHVGGPHAADSIVCYVPEDSFVYLGDSNSKDLYGSAWEYDPMHEERFMETLMAIPYDRERVAAYKTLLDGLAFTRCIGGHAEPMTKQELYASLA